MTFPVNEWDMILWWLDHAEQNLADWEIDLIIDMVEDNVDMRVIG